MNETTTKRQPIVYLAGPISEVENYWKPFEEADDILHSLGVVVLNPARLPQGMAKRDYMMLCLQMIDTADVVLLLEGWDRSDGATLERDFCRYVGKPIAHNIYEARGVIGV